MMTLPPRAQQPIKPEPAIRDNRHDSRHGCVNRAAFSHRRIEKNQISFERFLLAATTTKGTSAASYVDEI
jgi:hypothetical protein